MEYISIDPSRCKQYKTIEVILDTQQNNHGELLYIYLNRPQSMNSFNQQFVIEMNDLLNQLDTPRSSIKVVIIRGRGKIFSAGADIKEMSSASSSSTGNPMERFLQTPLSQQQNTTHIITKMRRCPQVFIAAINGSAAGAGFSLMLACDLRISLTNARFSCAYVNLGLTGCEMGSSWLLPRIIGEARAAEMMYTGRFMDASTAFKCGMLCQVVDNEIQLDTAVKELASDILSKTLLQIRMTKEGLNAAANMTLEQTRHLEDRNQVLCMKDEESMGGAAKYAMSILNKSFKPKFVAKL